MTATASSTTSSAPETISEIDLSTEPAGSTIVVTTNGSTHWITTVAYAAKVGMDLKGVAIQSDSEELQPAPPTVAMITAVIRVGSSFCVGHYTSSTVESIRRVSRR